MVQELHVLRCFSCDTFQSHIVKKTKNFECKVCGTKQSIKKVYGRGSGKDCRIHTQKLNNLRREKEDGKQFVEQIHKESEEGLSLQTKHYNHSPQIATLFVNEETTAQLKESKWKEFFNEEISTDKKSEPVTDSISLPIRNFQSKSKKRERSTTNSSETHLPEEYCSRTEIYDSVDDIYSHFSHSGFTECLEQSQNLTHQEKLREISNISEVNLDSVDKDKVKSPVLKMRKFADIGLKNRVSLKWSKYLEPCKEDSGMCFKYLRANSCNDDKRVCLLVNGSKINIAKAKADNRQNKESHEVPDATDTTAKDKQPDLPLKEYQHKNQTLPVFEQTCEIDDDDFQLDF